MENSLSIDVFADLACPWCYIGERRLEAAAATLRRQHAGLSIETHWRPFQLQPDLPPEGLPWGAFVEAKFGGAGRAEAAFRHVASASAPDGITFRFDRMQRAPNTMDAHRLVLLAGGEGRAWEVARALFAAYFTEGRNLSDVDTLVDVAAGAGLAPVRVRAYLASDEGRGEVEASQALAGRLGIQGVPFFVIDGRYGLSGAQPVEAFVEVLEAVLNDAVRQEAG